MFHRANGGRQQLHRRTGNIPILHSSTSRNTLREQFGTSEPPVGAPSPAVPRSISTSPSGDDRRDASGLDYDFEDDASATFQDIHQFNQSVEDILRGSPASGTGLLGATGVAGDTQASEELDALGAENMLMKEELGRISLLLQRNYPDIYNQVISTNTISANEPGSQPPPYQRDRERDVERDRDLLALLKRKEHDLNTLYAQLTYQENELDTLRKNVKGLSDFIVQIRNKNSILDGIVELDDVHFEREIKQLALAVKNWAWKVARGVGIYTNAAGHRDTINRQGRLVLDKAEIERLVRTHSKVGVITAFVVDAIWRKCWNRYAPGLSDDEERVLRDLEDTMRRSGKIPMASINRWRASTLSHLSKSKDIDSQITSQINSIASEITSILSPLLASTTRSDSSDAGPDAVITTGNKPTPAEEKSLLPILEKAAILYAQLRCQKHRFELTFPSKGERYNCRIMEDASDIVVYDEEDLMGGTVGAVVFPGVVKWGDDAEDLGAGWAEKAFKAGYSLRSEERRGSSGSYSSGHNIGFVRVEGFDGSPDGRSLGGTEWEIEPAARIIHPGMVPPDGGGVASGQGLSGNSGGEHGNVNKPRVLAKARVLCLVEEEQE